jgi:hypothetical protein
VPDRIADALVQLNATLREVGATQATLATGLDHFALELRSIDRKRGRQLVAFGLMLALLLGAATVNLYTLQLVRCALTPGCHVYDDNAKRSADVVGGLVTEQDCRVRLAQLGRPAPTATDPTGRQIPCTKTVGPDVYPGTERTP